MNIKYTLGARALIFFMIFSLGPGVLLSGCGFSISRLNPFYEEPVPAVTVSGFLDRVMAIGGETTGWSISLSGAMKFSDGTKVDSIEVDPAGKAIDIFSGKRVEITGIVEEREGVERGPYRVILLRGIKGL